MFHLFSPRFFQLPNLRIRVNLLPTSLAFSNRRSLRLPVWELKGSWGAFPCATAARGSNLISGLKFELMI